MKLTFKDLPFIIHDCGLINFYLNGETYHFRLAIPGYKAKTISDQITDEDNESLVLDIILYKVQVKKLFFESADFNFLNCDVFAFEIDDDGNAEITFFDENQFDLDLKCESYEIIPMRVIKDDQLFSKDITIEDFFTIE